MMPDYALHNGSRVLNVIVAESAEVATTITGLDSLEAVDGRPSLGWTLDENGWRSPASPPYPSWSWDYGVMEYVAPVPKPDEGYWWDEDDQSWKPWAPPVFESE